MTFFVYGCKNCQKPESVRTVESKTHTRPHSFKCFNCEKSRVVKREAALFSSDDYVKAKNFMLAFRNKMFELQKRGF